MSYVHVSSLFGGLGYGCWLHCQRACPLYCTLNTIVELRVLPIWPTQSLTNTTTLPDSVQKVRFTALTLVRPRASIPPTPVNTTSALHTRRPHSRDVAAANLNHLKLPRLHSNHPRTSHDSKNHTRSAPHTMSPTPHSPPSNSSTHLAKHKQSFDAAKQSFSVTESVATESTHSTCSRSRRVWTAIKRRVREHHESVDAVYANY